MDVYIDSWEKCGLKLPSVIRIHKVATLEKNLVELIMGKIDKQLRVKVKSIFSKLTELRLLLKYSIFPSDSI